MPNKDIVSLSTDKLNEISNAYYDLTEIDPKKVAIFVKEKEFPLTNFALVVSNKQDAIPMEFEWNEYKQCLSVGNYAMRGDFTDLGIELNPLKKNYKDLHAKKAYYFARGKKETLLAALRARYGNDYTIDDFFGTQVYFFIMLQIILTTKPEWVKKEKKKVNETISVKKNGQTRYKSVVYIKDYYTFSDKKLTKSDITHIIKCPAWGVRGHYRHLSNGTVIFIKPYVKGKYRNDPTKYVAKTYKT